METEVGPPEVTIKTIENYMILMWPNPRPEDKIINWQLKVYSPCQDAFYLLLDLGSQDWGMIIWQ